MEGRRPQLALSLPQLSLLDEEGREQQILEDENFLGKQPVLNK
jgi:hypothetical protein